MLNLKTVNNVNDQRIEELTYAIYDYFRDKIMSITSITFAAVYVCYLSAEQDKTGEELKAYIHSELPEKRRMFLSENLEGDYSFVGDMTSKFKKEEFAAYMYKMPQHDFRNNTFNSTPDAISELARTILNIQPNETAADFGSGYGTFLCQTATQNTAQYYGFEINTSATEISEIRAELFTDNVVIKQRDMFQIEHDQLFDKIFSNYPFGIRIKELLGGQEYLERLRERIPDIKRATSSDWIFNMLLLDHLVDGGKAVAVMTNGSTWNGIDENIRAYFVREGFIEAIISLPPRMFEYTSIPTTMIVLSKGNEKIRMIDAQNLYTQGRRKNSLSEDNIKEISQLLKKDGELSKQVKEEELRNNNYVLNPERYLQKEIVIHNGVEFGSLIKSITRGAPLSARDLDGMVSKVPTKTRYMMLSNIQNGIIEKDLPYMKELDPKLRKYCIKNRNLLLSKNGAPFKIAIAEIEEGVDVLGNGNLYIIELDEEKVDPYYLKAFFDSEIGQLSIQRITVGATIPSVPVKALKKLKVPQPPLEEQRKIAETYRAKINEIKVLQLRVEKAQNELKGIFSEGV